MNQYAALLRGINVGGKNKIKMTDLAACFEGLGLIRVRTYIQSGNVLFFANESNQAGLTGRIEEVLSKTFNFDSRLVLRSHAELRDIVTQAPEGFGSDLSTYRYDFIFLKEPLTAAEAMESITMKEGVDQVTAGDGVLYASRLISRAAQSHISRIVGLPIYASMTIRNWNTTTRLLAMMDGAGQ